MFATPGFMSPSGGPALGPHRKWRWISTNQSPGARGTFLSFWEIIPYTTRYGTRVDLSGATVIASSEQLSPIDYNKNKAFDLDLQGTRWVNDTSSPNHAAEWIGLDAGAGNEMEIRGFTIRAYNSASFFTGSFNLEYSDNNGVTWKILKTFTVPAITDGNLYTFWVDEYVEEVDFKYWAVFWGTTPAANYMGCFEIEMMESLGGGDVTDVAYAAVYRQRTIYVPTNAFDNNNSSQAIGEFTTVAAVLADGHAGRWLGQLFPATKNIVKITLRNSGRGPDAGDNFTLRASNNIYDWKVIQTWAPADWVTNPQTFVV